jgi:hypothetical protein
VKQVNTFAFYEMGTKLCELRRLSPRTERITAMGQALWPAKALQAFVQDTHEVPFVHSKAAAADLLDIINRLYKSDKEGQTIDLDESKAPIGESRAGRIERSLADFEAVFAQEAKAIEVYAVGQKGIYSTSSLVENADRALPEDVRNRLSAASAYDLRQAGKCLAFDVPTAAGYHVIKSVEPLIRDYHFKLTGRKLAAKNRSWGVYIRDMARHPKVDRQVTAFLTHIKDAYRNPLMHAEVTLTSDEASMLFGAAISAILMLDKAIQGP